MRARRDRIENAAEIAEGVTRALGALDASQVADDVESASAADLIDRASQALRAIHVEGVFSEFAHRLDSISTDLSDVVFSLSGEVDNEASVEDLDAINGRIHELDELTRRWGPELSDVITWRDKAVYDLEDLDASPEKVEQLEAERAQLLEAAKKAAQAVSKRRRAAAKELASKVTAELDSLAMGTSKLEIRVAEREQLDVTGADDIEFLFTPFPGSPQLPMGKSASGGELSRLMLALELVAAEKHVVAGGTVPPMTFIFDEVDAGVGGKAAVELGARLAKLAQSAQVWSSRTYHRSHPGRTSNMWSPKVKRMTDQSPPPSVRCVEMSVCMKSPACFPAAKARHLWNMPRNYSNRPCLTDPWPIIAGKSQNQSQNRKSENYNNRGADMTQETMSNQGKGAIFDLDGTLLDSMGVWDQVDVDFLAKRGIEVPDDYMQKVAAMQFRQIAEYTIARFSLSDTPEER